VNVGVGVITGVGVRVGVGVGVTSPTPGLVLLPDTAIADDRAPDDERKEQPAHCGAADADGVAGRIGPDGTGGRLVQELRQ
jgi:hypothetical protein